jgi:hypothetical protein
VSPGEAKFGPGCVDVSEEDSVAASPSPPKPALTGAQRLQALRDAFKLRCKCMSQLQLTMQSSGTRMSSVLRRPRSLPACHRLRAGSSQEFPSHGVCGSPPAAHAAAQQAEPSVSLPVSAPAPPTPRHGAPRQGREPSVSDGPIGLL